MPGAIKLLSCPQGHFWETPEGADEPHCPVCGELPESLPLLAPAPDETLTAEPAATTPERPAVRRPAVPGYEIVEDRGRTGVGVAMYVAKQDLVPRTVLLKVVTAATDRGQRAWGALRGEAVALGKVSHPNVVQLYGAGECNRELFYNAVEFVDGPTLAQKWSAKPLPFRQAAALVEVLARAVQFAHDQGVVHRSLRPAAVQLQLHKSEGRSGAVDPPYCLVHSMRCIPKISGFGLARRPVEGEINDLDLQEGMPAYLAPEQVWGRAKDVGVLTDVYALGAILYELVSGEPPFSGPTLSDTLDCIQSKPPPPPRKWRGGVPADLAAVCEKCLEKQPRHRYRSAAALADDLRRYLDGRSVHARPVGVLGRASRAVWRRPSVTLLAATTLALLAALALVANAPRADRPGQPAVTAPSPTKTVTQWRVPPPARVETRDNPLAAYQRSLALAQRAIRAKEDDRALNHLEKSPPHLRDWEWYALSQQAHHVPRPSWTRPLAPVHGLDFSPDNACLAAFGHDDGTRASLVTIWNESGEQVIRAKAAGGRLTALSWAPDSGSVRALDERGSVWQIKRHDGVQYEVPLAGCGVNRVGALAARDGTGQRWQTAAVEGAFVRVHEARRSIVQLAAGADETLCLAFCPHRNYLAAGDARGFVRVWDMGTSRQLCVLEGHAREVVALAFNHSGTRLVSGSRDGGLCVWDPAEGREIFRFDEPGPEPTALAFRTVGHRLVVARGYEITQWGD
jgi:serine/threonine protein kinase